MPSDRERFSEAIERCRNMARGASNAGYQQLWTTVADSYRCLHDNEVRSEANARDRVERLKRDRQATPPPGIP